MKIAYRVFLIYQTIGQQEEIAKKQIISRIQGKRKKKYCMKKMFISIKVI